MKKLVLIVTIMFTMSNMLYGYGVKGMRWGVRKSSYSTPKRSYSIPKRSYSTRSSYRSTSGHGQYACGYKNCHGNLCCSSGTSKTFDNITKGIRTVNNTVRTIDMHRKTEKDLEYKDLRNEKLRRELETGRQIARPIIITREVVTNVSETIDTPISNTDDIVVDLTCSNNKTVVKCPKCDEYIHYTRTSCRNCGLKISIKKDNQ